MNRTLLLAASLAGPVLLTVSGCSPSGNAAPAVTSSDFGDVFPSDHFLEFLNHANYTLVAATATAGQTDSFTLTVTYNDGSTQTFTGGWNGSAGKASKDPRNPSFGIAINTNDGFTAKLSSSTDNYLYLLDATGTVIAEDDNGGGGTNAQISLTGPASYSSTYTSAYYTLMYSAMSGTGAVVTTDQRDTFPGWLQANGFNDPSAPAAIHHVVMRDALDLGYGRDIHFLQHQDCSVSVYVRNYQVTGVPGQDYSALNLDAAVNQVEQYHIGTNAIEWGPLPATSSPPVASLADPTVCSNTSTYVLRFYSYDPGGTQPRRSTIDMDGRGQKAMPIPCMTCHGGKADPMLANGDLRLLQSIVATPDDPTHHGQTLFLNRDNFGHLQPLRVDSFDYSTEAGYTRADQEASFAAINQAVYDSYLWNESPPLHYGFWNSNTARSIMANWYASGGNNPDPTSPNQRFQNAVFQGDYTPAGWQPDPQAGSPPPGSNSLYSDVISENCRLCHLLRGNVYQSDIDLQAYSKFANYAPRIEDLVYDEGLMPLAQRTFDNFYSVTGLPEELASFIPGFSHYDSSGKVLLPGRPVADPGPSRTVPSPAPLDASASILASGYAWSVIATPPGATATLSAASGQRVTLTADTDGAYTVQLVVTSSKGVASDPATMTVNIDHTATPPSQLRFETSPDSSKNIKTILQSSCAGVCHTPHIPADGKPLPPVYYSQPPVIDPATGVADANEINRDVYTDVMGRVNLSDPSASLILEKPSGHSHGGNLVGGFDLNGDHSKYDLVLNWILGGAQR